MILGLRQKLIAVLLPIVILPLLGLGSLFYLQQRDMLQSHALEKMQDIMASTEGEFASSMSSRYASIQLLSESHLIRRYLIVEDENARYYSFYRPILELFASYQQTFPEFSEVMILNRSGGEEVRLARSDMPDATSDITQQPWFKEALKAGNQRLVKIDKGSHNRRASIVIVKPIPTSIYTDWQTTQQATIGGYLVVRIEPRRLFDIVENKRIGEGGILLLLNAEGEQLLPSYRQSGAPPSLVKQLYQRRLGMDRGIELMVWENNRYLASYRPLLDDLALFAYWPEKEKLAIVESVALRVFWFTLITLIIVGLLLFSVVNRLVIHPILQLKELATAIGQGQFNYLGADAAKFIESGNREDEVGELTRAIQEMSINLEASRLKMQFTAHHDSLTGLNNRHSFMRYLDQAIKSATVRQGEIAVLFIDTDGFKEVNDTLGHGQGDKVLKVIAKRLARATRANRHVLPEEPTKLSLNRIGGDEFAIVLEGEDSRTEADRVATALINEMVEPFMVDQQPYHLGISIGIAMFPTDGKDVNTLLKRADIAMYKAKADGGNRYQCYDPVLEKSAMERHLMAIELRQALNDNQFCLYYQPQYDAQNGALIGCEALIRWNHPERGMVPPGLFISHAEQNGLIIPIGEWALGEACRQNRAWQVMGLKPIKVAVNFSTMQFNRTIDIVSVITSSLQHSGMEASYLDVEITETGIMQSDKVGLDILNKIKAAGVHISMDDFGTGYSSLAALRDMPIDTLKIDKSFVDGIDAGANGQAIIKAIIAMAKQLNLSIVAEGVEEESQLEFLKVNGCDFLQGFLLARPLSASVMESLLRQHTVAEQNDTILDGGAGYSI